MAERSVVLCIEVVLVGDSEDQLDRLEELAREHMTNELTGQTIEADPADGYEDDGGTFEFCEVWTEVPRDDSIAEALGLEPGETDGGLVLGAIIRAKQEAEEEGRSVEVIPGGLRISEA